MIPCSKSNTSRSYYRKKPLLWRAPWLQDLIDALVIDDDPTGSITSVEFERAGVLTQLDTLEHFYEIPLIGLHFTLL